MTDMEDVAQTETQKDEEILNMIDQPEVSFCFSTKISFLCV